MSASYAHVRSAVHQDGTDTRVEVNQRALIDKILARYSSPNAVYRELLQNSNDAEAKNAEIFFTTTTVTAAAGTTASASRSNRPSPNQIVTQVVYRNDGKPFRPEDWSRLRNIAEGNPDVSKVGAFGVGAYTMFSICEEPLIISGDMALSFSWRGDSLWARTAPIEKKYEKQGENFNKWTTFALPSRDPYAFPDIVPFGQFLCASLSFTASLSTISVFSDGTSTTNDSKIGNAEGQKQPVLTISKQLVEGPMPVTPPRASSWFARDAMITSSPNGIFTLPSHTNAISQTVRAFTVKIGESTHTLRARFMSAVVDVVVQPDMLRRIQRVTKKNPPRRVPIHVFVSADANESEHGDDDKQDNQAQRVTRAFTPQFGAGRIFIGFRTSQTTGLAAHLAAPLVPTVEREAVDLQDSALRTYNSDLLFIAGTLMRLTLENAMGNVGLRYDATRSTRKAFDDQYERERREKKKQKGKPLTEAPDAKSTPVSTGSSSTPSGEKTRQGATGGADGDTGGSGSGRGGNGIFSFVRFMTSGVRNLASAITGIGGDDGDDGNDREDDLMNPADPRPLSDEERDAIMLMKAFSPQPSTPDQNVGALIARGFMACMPRHTPPVLTRSGVVRADDARLPYRGIEYFVRHNVVRKVVYSNARPFFEHVADCRRLQVEDLVAHLKTRTLEQDEFIRLIKWWVKFSRGHDGQTGNISGQTRLSLRNAVSVYVDSENVVEQSEAKQSEQDRKKVTLDHLRFYRADELNSPSLPMPSSVLPLQVQQKLSMRVLRDDALSHWFRPVPFAQWATNAVTHRSMTDGRSEDDEVRLEILGVLSKNHGRRQGVDRRQFETWICETMGKQKSIPFERLGPTDNEPEPGIVTDLPSDLYMRDAEIGIFQGLGSFRKVSASLERAGVSNSMLLALGVRKAISIDFLFTQLSNLKWNDDPRALIRYLRSATLSRGDLDKLRQSQYLPAAGDKSRMFAPTELYLPSEELDLFPMIRKLQWPDALHERSPDATFLKSIGCQTDPPLIDVLQFIANGRNEDATTKTDAQTQFKCLEFVAKRLGPGGVYKPSLASYSHVKFIPAIRNDPMGIRLSVHEMHSYSSCYANAGSACMGFAVLDPALDTGVGRMFGERFHCRDHPGLEQLTSQLIHLSSYIQKKYQLGRSSSSSSQTSTTPTSSPVADELTKEKVLSSFAKIFDYLSSRPFDDTQKRRLQTVAFIPYVNNSDDIEWCRPNEVYFQQSTDQDSKADGRTANDDEDDGLSQLFKAIPFNSFLATIGVQAEPSMSDVMKMIIASPPYIYRRVGGERPYLRLLRRLASSSFGSKVTSQMSASPFLIGYKPQKPSDENEDLHDANGNSTQQRNSGLSLSNINDGENTNADISEGQTSEPFLAKAADISLVDNTSFVRMFSVLTAPQESELERFYELLGSEYISKQVQKRFLISAPDSGKTEVTKAFEARLVERRPLLVSSNMRSSPLQSDALAILSDKSVRVKQVSGVMAQFRLGNLVKRQKVTCGAELTRRPIMRCNIFITNQVDWFDVGTAIGDVILKRPRLEDAFFLGSILEAPLTQLRAHGFPVDRILKYNTEQQQKRKQKQEEERKRKEERQRQLEKEQQQQQQQQQQHQQHQQHQQQEQQQQLQQQLQRRQQQQQEQQQPQQESQAPVQSHASGFEEILKQKFPDCSRAYIREKLGPQPTLDTLRTLGEELSSGKYPREPAKAAKAENSSVGTSTGNSSPSDPSKTPSTSRLVKGFINRALGRKPGLSTTTLPPSGIPGVNLPIAYDGTPSSGVGSGTSSSGAGTGESVGAGAQSRHVEDPGKRFNPSDDAAAHDHIEQTLQRAAQSTRPVNPSGVSWLGGASETGSGGMSDAEDTAMDLGTDCDASAVHILSPWKNGVVVRGLRVFRTKGDIDSANFIHSHRDALDIFAMVLHNLCLVCEIPTSSASIYHESTGRIIAFNQARALHFNFRFFVALHWRNQRQASVQCYTYWLTTMCHELAHNLVSEHGKQHGFLTETFVSMFMPNLIAHLPQFLNSA